MMYVCRSTCRDALVHNVWSLPMDSDIFTKTLQELAETKYFLHHLASAQKEISTTKKHNNENINEEVIVDNMKVPNNIHDKEELFGNMLYLQPTRPWPLVPTESTLTGEAFNILHEFIYTRYFDTNDLQMKCIIIEMYQEASRLYTSATQQLLTIAFDAAKMYNKNVELSFAGYSLLIRMFHEKLIQNISDDVMQQIFCIMSDGLARFGGSSRLFCLQAICRLINSANHSLINDQQLELLNKNVLALLKQPAKLFSSELSTNLWTLNFTSNLSISFGIHMRKYISLYKEAILQLAKSELRNNPQTGKPFVSRAEILAFYYYLAVELTKEIGGEYITAEVKEFSNTVINNGFGLSLSEADIAEFSAYACNAIYYGGLCDDPEKASNFIRTLLTEFDPDILAYGVSFIHDQCDYTSELPSYIPNNMKEFEESMQQFNEKKKSWFQKQSTLIQQCFTFKDSWEQLMEDYNDYPEDHLDEEALEKITKTNVNPNRRHEGMYYSTRELCSKPQQTSIVSLLTEIFKQEDGKKFLEFAQPTLHIILANIRANGALQYCGAILNLYELLEPQLSPVDQRYYLEIIMHSIYKKRKFMTQEDVEPCQAIQEKVLQCIEKYNECHPALICDQLRMAKFYSHKQGYSLKSRLLYGTWKRVLAASPRKTLAVVECSRSIISLDKLAAWEEKTLIFASIGFHFGVRLVKRVHALEHKCQQLIQLLKTDSEADKEEIELLERFLILKEVAHLDSKTRDLCLFNAPFSEHEKAFLRAIRHLTWAMN